MYWATGGRYPTPLTTNDHYLRAIGSCTVRFVPLRHAVKMMFRADGRVFHRPLAISVAGLIFAGVGLAVTALILAVAHRDTGQALAYIPVAVGLTAVAVMMLRGTRWAIQVVIVGLAGQLAAIAGIMWELSHGIDARKASQLRQLGFDPTAGVVINLIYSSIGFALFCWFATRWLVARRRAPDTGHNGKAKRGKMIRHG